MNTFRSYCTPAKIYLTIAAIYCIIQLFTVPIVFVLINFGFALIWAFILQWLCSKGFSSVSWFLVLLPYVAMLFQALGFISFSSYAVLTRRYITTQFKIVLIMSLFSSFEFECKICLAKLH